MTVAAVDLYEAALQSVSGSGLHGHWYTRTASGSRYPLGGDLRRWCGVADATDRAVLDRCPGTVLDVGCGPGRMVAELERTGRQGLGLDTSKAAVRLTRASGAVAVRGSVFDPVPGEGCWDTVLLADGNIGIDGDPAALLDRCRALIGPGGRIVVELAPDGTGLRTDRVRLERTGERGEWFDWALLGPDAVAEVAAAAGLWVPECWEDDGRRFAVLLPTGIPAADAAALDPALDLAS